MKAHALTAAERATLAAHLADLAATAEHAQELSAVYVLHTLHRIARSLGSHGHEDRNRGHHGHHDPGSQHAPTRRLDRVHSLVASAMRTADVEARSALRSALVSLEELQPEVHRLEDAAADREDARAELGAMLDRLATGVFREVPPAEHGRTLADLGEQWRSHRDRVVALRATTSCSSTCRSTR